MEGKEFYRCDICGNLFGIIEDAGVVPECCGQEMTRLKPNTSDGAGEKHVPVIERAPGGAVVKVGSVAHPMLPEHHIQWIVIVNGDHVERAVLTPGGKPEAGFCLPDAEGPIKAYEYCNLHGLWEAEI